MASKRKVGIMGGTFDPIHTGHLILAENAYEKFELDKVLVMPSGQPPHKTDKTITNAAHRSTMIKLAISDNPHLEYSGYELERDGYIYTAETLTGLKEEYPATEFYFIVGADSLFSIEKWKDPELIFQNSVILAAKRDEVDDIDLEKQMDNLSQKYQARIEKLDVPYIGISSSMIRFRVSNRETIKYFVHSEVEKYIYKNNLYKQF